MDLDKATQ